jgi:hypothetical protein
LTQIKATRQVFVSHAVVLIERQTGGLRADEVGTMPKGIDSVWRRAFWGLLVLALFVMPVVQAQTVLLTPAHIAMQTHDDRGEAKLTVSLPFDCESGSCCDRDGLACCSPTGCPMFAGWLAADATALPLLFPKSSVYRVWASEGLDGLDQTPAVPPPRRIV